MIYGRTFYCVKSLIVHLLYTKLTPCYSKVLRVFFRKYSVMIVVLEWCVCSDKVMYLMFYGQWFLIEIVMFYFVIFV